MPQAPREYATELLAEARETHPELRGPRAPARADPARGGNIATESINHIVSARMAAAMEKHYGVPRASLDFYYEHVEVEEDHGERAIRILERIALTDAAQARGRLALRRAIAVRRLCADGMYQAFISEGRS